MPEFFPGIVIGFREGLEAFLIIAIMIRYLKKTKRSESIKYVWRGAILGILLSLVIGSILYLIARSLDNVGPVAKLWESGASVFALILVTTFIMWMIRNGSNIKLEIENKTAKTISNIGIVVLTFAFIAREGVEVAIFTFAGDYSLLAIFIGILISLVLTILVFFSLVKVNLKVIFNITLVYLILQAGFLLGYAFHEGMSAFKDLGLIDSNNLVFTKLFDLSNTALDHKTGFLGIPLYAGIGWYSRPEIMQFIIQYSYTFSIFGYWYYYLKKQSKTT
jgi:high-affinity iron transporter